MPACSAISRYVVGLAIAAFALIVARPQVALSQNVTRQNKCAVSESLKPTKTDIVPAQTLNDSEPFYEGEAEIYCRVSGHGGNLQTNRARTQTENVAIDA